jgi:hypothetical protein
MAFDLPQLFLSDLLVLLLAFAPPLLLGIPVIMRGVRQPPEIEVEELAGETLDPRTRRWHEALDRKFAALGYRPAGTFRIPNVPHQRILLRAWTSPAEPAVAAAFSLLDERGQAANSATWLEFWTEFASGRSVATASLRRSHLRRSVSFSLAHDAPGVLDPARLKARHERNCARHLVRGPQFPKPEEFPEKLRSAWRRDLAHMRGTGLFRLRPDGGTGLSTYGAFRYTLDSLSPFSGEGGPLGLALALLLGSGLPFLAQSAPLALAVPGFSLGPPAAAVAALATGALLGGRGIFWAPALVWLGQRVALGDLAPLGGFSILATVVASQALAAVASNARARLRARV